MSDSFDPDDQRLREMLRAALEAEAAAMSPDAGLAQLHQRLQHPAWWRRIGWPALPSLAPWTITALASLCVVQAWLLWQPHEPSEPHAVASELQWRSVPGLEAQPAASLRARFAPGASMAQVSAALAQAGATIVAGPLADGSYLLDAAEPPAALRSLQASGITVEAATTPSHP